MQPRELRQPDDVRDFLLHGLWLQRVARVDADSLTQSLEWIRVLAAEGEALPPVGFVTDVGHLVFDAPTLHGDRVHVPGIEPGLVRAYEDYVLGKLYADHSFERAADAVRHYAIEDRPRGLRFLVGRLLDRAGHAGVTVNPAVVKGLLQEDPGALLEASWETLAETGPHLLVVEQLERLVIDVRNLGDLLAPEDVFELEHRTALAEFGQRLALRQVFRAAAALETAVPPRPSDLKRRRQEIATRMLDEDAYPIGGFTSISNRGSIESLLHSQLAYMEPAGAERPDLFDVKFLRDELLYYARDENAFLRRRRTFVFALYPDLATARVKDPGLAWQRIILVMALVLVAIRRTTDWLGDDALVFEIRFVGDDGESLDLADERELLEMLLREQIVNGMVSIESIRERELPAHCDNAARTSTCHAIAISSRDRRLDLDAGLLTRLVVSRATIQWAFDDDPLETTQAETPRSAWETALVRLLDDFAST